MHSIHVDGMIAYKTPEIEGSHLDHFIKSRYILRILCNFPQKKSADLIFIWLPSVLQVWVK